MLLFRKKTSTIYGGLKISILKDFAPFAPKSPAEADTSVLLSKNTSQLYCLQSCACQFHLISGLGPFIQCYIRGAVDFNPQISPNPHHVRRTSLNRTVESGAIGCLRPR